MIDTYHYDSLYIAIIHQACKDLYRLYNKKHRTPKENWELDDLMKWFDDMGLEKIKDKIIIEHWKPTSNTQANLVGDIKQKQFDDYDE